MPFKAPSKSLLALIRLGMAAVLLISLCITALIWHVLSLIENRAADLHRETAPLVLSLKETPDVVGDLRRLLDSSRDATSQEQLDAVEAQFSDLALRLQRATDLNATSLLQDFQTLMSLQDRMLREKASIEAVFKNEAINLETPLWEVETALMSALASLGGAASIASQQEVASGLLALLGVEKNLSQIVAETRGAALLDPADALEKKALLVRQINSLTVHLGRLARGPLQANVAAAIQRYRENLLGPGRGFDQISALVLEQETVEMMMAGLEAEMRVIDQQTGTAAVAAVQAFEAAAAENAATIRTLRHGTFALNILLWAVCLLGFWWLIDRRLFARIEALVARQRDMAEGNLSNPISVVQADEFGELETAAERFRTTARALSDTHARTEAILSGAPDAILAIDDGGRVLLCNDAALGLFAGEGDGLVGRDISEFLVNGSSLLERSGGAMKRVESCGIRHDGSVFPIEVSVSHLGSEEGGQSIIVTTDITKRKEADSRLGAALADLERSNADLNNFAYIASHDLKAPLRVIDNATGWLEEDLAPHLTEDTRQTMDLLRGRTKRMERLLDDLLAYSRVGRAEVSDQVISGDQLFGGICDLLNLPDGFTVSRNDAFANMIVRKMPLQTVLLNLVSNALKHHDKPTGRIEVVATPKGDHTEFAVTDDGPGIPPEYHERIFGLFQTLQARDVVEGSGMGLAMVKRYLEVVGGEIFVEAPETGGTRFRFTWPNDMPSEDADSVIDMTLTLRAKAS